MADLSLVPVEDLRAEITAREAAEKLVRLDAARDEIIDELDVLTYAKAAGFTIETDAKDDQWCILVLPVGNDGGVDPRLIGQMAALEGINQARTQDLPGERIRVQKNHARRFLQAENQRLTPR